MRDFTVILNSNNYSYYDDDDDDDLTGCVRTGPDAPGGVAYQRDPYYPDWVRRTCLVCWLFVALWKLVINY